MKVKVKRLSDEDRDRLSDEFEAAWRQRVELARKKYWSERPDPRGTFENAAPKVEGEQGDRNG